MVSSADRPETRLATRVSFFAAGFGMASWAPLVPFAKANVGVDEGVLGALLLCLGIGSIVAMPLTGWLSARFGTKSMVLAGGFGLVVTLPALMLAGSAPALGVVLLLFGASLGTIDVAMNIHSVEVQNDAPVPLLSGFHALFSVGGFAGSGGVTLLLTLGSPPLVAALASAALTFAAMVVAWPRLLRRTSSEPVPFALPHGIVLLLCLLAAIMFLVEGAMLDWSALLVVSSGLIDAAQGGVGYMIFSVAMTIGRFSGDWIVARAGERRVLVVGGLLAISGIALLLTAPVPPVALCGFLLIGFGASNIVPVLFGLAGRQKVMAPALAAAAVTTIGYAGILAGPAAIGFVADMSDLKTAFWLLAGLTAIVPLMAGAVTRPR